MKLYEWIKKTIDDTAGLTQKGLARATGMNPATVNRMMYGRRHIRAEEVPCIEEYLGKKYNVDNQNQTLESKSFSNPMENSTEEKLSLNIPVYKSSFDADFTLDCQQIVDWVERHPQQKGDSRAFAIYVSTNIFEPRYYMGELVYVHVGRPPVISQDCCIEKHDGTFLLCRYMGQVGNNVSLIDLQTNQEFKLKYNDIKDLYAVVGRG